MLVSHILRSGKAGSRIAKPTSNYFGSSHALLHSCQVSRNGRDSPGIWAYVPAASRLTQKAANVPEFLQTSTLEEQIWRLLSQEEFVSLSEAKKATHFNSKLLLVSIFGTAWLFATPINKLWPAGKWAGLANMGGANKFRGRENNCPGCLIQKLGNYGSVTVPGLVWWHLSYIACFW